MTNNQNESEKEFAIYSNEQERLLNEGQTYPNYDTAMSVLSNMMLFGTIPPWAKGTKLEVVELV